MANTNKGNMGYTLIELATVIMIIAILISSIASGAALLRQSQLRSVINEATMYTDAINLFKQKYKSLPGDYPYASTQWGTACDPTPNNCNGNGDGVIYPSSSLSQNEALRAWQHLSLAGMIQGSYTGTTSSAGLNVPGTNVPYARYPAGVWTIFYDEPYGPPIYFGQVLRIYSASNPTSSLLPPNDAYVLDVKIDDGYPRNGLVWGDTAMTYCFLNATYINSPYNLSATDTSPRCTLSFNFSKSNRWF